ncbi:unnamed protein product [Euphydryas editha]|uniref:Reverse transcriptase domain-containing protein n=1 Tax=Euphydryas editha TaxID=104508 RepID=A0AAU9UB49_EUPED|nr:unnamed protein product [Euphydryas editha]
MTGIDTPIYPLKDIDGKRRYAASDRAEILAEHLERQFTPNPPNMTNTNVVDHHKEIKSIIQAFNTTQFSQLRCEDMITPLELRKTIQRLPKRKAPGKDEITNATLTKLPKNCIQAITTLYNGILQTGHFPEAWKQGRVIVIPKPGKDKRLPSSYRPITLLSHVAKLFERLLLRRLVPHLPLREEQFDMEKAFDRVWHEGLLAKLIRTTTPPAIIKIIASFLKGRSFYVSLEGADSQPRLIQAGVPQGSCLSPLLYAAYTDDIPTLRDHLREGEKDVMLALYADDSAYFASSYHQIVATNQMQRLLDLLPEWLDRWRMAVNVGKTAALLTGGARPLRQLTLRGQDVEWKTSVRYLGCHFDRRLRMIPTVDQMVHQAAAARSKLHSLLTSRLPLRLKLKIYGAYVRSRLTYAAPAWYALCSANQAQRMQIQQNRCLRLIVGAPRYVKNDVIHKDTKMPTVEEYVRRLARTMFARADNSACTQLHGIAPLHARPPEGRPLPRELLLSTSGPNTDIDDNENQEEEDAE